MTRAICCFKIVVVKRFSLTTVVSFIETIIFKMFLIVGKSPVCIFYPKVSEISLTHFYTLFFFSPQPNFSFPSTTNLRIQLKQIILYFFMSLFHLSFQKVSTYPSSKKTCKMKLLQLLCIDMLLLCYNYSCTALD